MVISGYSVDSWPEMFKTISKLVGIMYATWRVCEMDKDVENLVTCELRFAIRFINLRNTILADVYRQIRNVHEKQFNEGRTNGHDDERTERPSLVNNDFVCQVGKNFNETRGLPRCHYQWIFLKSSFVLFFVKLC